MHIAYGVCVVCYVRILSEAGYVFSSEKVFLTFL